MPATHSWTEPAETPNSAANSPAVSAIRSISRRHRSAPLRDVPATATRRRPTALSSASSNSSVVFCSVSTTNRHFQGHRHTIPLGLIGRIPYPRSAEGDSAVQTTNMVPQTDGRLKQKRGTMFRACSRPTMKRSVLNATLNATLERDSFLLIEGDRLLV